MTGEIAAAGDLATGALWGHAVEPPAGSHAASHEDSEGGLCLNCGTRRVGAFCHACGQSGHVHRTAGAIGHEIAHGVFHFEGKIWRTLPMLALRPGELTRRYIAGERARFVSPVAIFLFSVFLLFAVVASLPGWQLGDGDFLKGSGGVEEARAKLADEELTARAGVAKYARRVTELQTAGPDRAEDLAEARSDLATARKAQAGLHRAQRYLPAPDGEQAATSEPGNWYEAKYRQAKENPKLLLYKIKTSAYKYSWALIPISLPFIWMLFPFRRDVGMYDHAVFATYSLSFMSLLVVVLALLGAVGVSSGLISLAALIIPPLHIYKQLKGGYKLRRAGALWRTGWMLLFTTLTSTFFMLLLVYLGTAD